MKSHSSYTLESKETIHCPVCFQRFINLEGYEACIKRHGVEQKDREHVSPEHRIKWPGEKPRHDSKQESVRDELGSLVHVKRKPNPDEHVLSSGPSRSAFSYGSSSRNSPGSFRLSLGRGGFSFKSPKSYESAVSTFSSYKTAPLSHAEWNDQRYPHQGVADLHGGPVIDYADLTEFVDCIMAMGEKLSIPAPKEARENLKIDLIRSMHDLAYNIDSFFSGLTLASDRQERTATYIQLATVLGSQIRKILHVKSGSSLTDLDNFIQQQLEKFVETRGKSHSVSGATLAAITGTKVFSSKWLQHLQARGIIVDPKDELDWSGRGQHVEYTAKEEKDIPLRYAKILGHSATALVESVMCRRIQLARKKIRCSRRLSKEDAVTEVQHLQRLQHAHVVRVVGTYTLKKDLAILLYPAAEWNLEEFMDETVEVSGAPEWQGRNDALITFFGCLGSTLAFLHEKMLKHMDIKPKNILVRTLNLNPDKIHEPWAKPKERYRLYIADFGIARAYQSAADVETDSPTSFTRTYAAPEVVDQETRGFSADIFSLGCVFMEMLATILSEPSPEHNQREILQNLRCNENGDTSFHANIELVNVWYKSKAACTLTLNGHSFAVDRISTDYVRLLPRMISESPKSRPDARTLANSTLWARCSSCDAGPEPFEAAKISPDC